METTEKLKLYNKALKVLVVISILLCGPPVAIYAWARANGSLPSEVEWAQRGYNHGPWWGEPLELWMYLPLLAFLVLPSLTFMLALAMTLEMKGHRMKTLARGVAAAILQAVICWPALFIFWTVD